MFKHFVDLVAFHHMDLQSHVDLPLGKVWTINQILVIPQSSGQNSLSDVVYAQCAVAWYLESSPHLTLAQSTHSSRQSRRLLAAGFLLVLM